MKHALPSDGAGVGDEPIAIKPLQGANFARKFDHFRK